MYAASRFLFSIIHIKTLKAASSANSQSNEWHPTHRPLNIAEGSGKNTLEGGEGDTCSLTRKKMSLYDRSHSTEKEKEENSIQQTNKGKSPTSCGCRNCSSSNNSKEKIYISTHA